MYTKEEVYNSTLKYFKNDELATNVWINKYALKDLSGNLLELNPDMMHKRLAKEVTRIEKKYPNPLSEGEIYGLLKDFKYIIPQGGPMSGIGNDYQIMSISNCFYLDHKGDSYGSIMDIDEKLVHIFKRRGGCGVDISKLRPSKGKVKNAALSSSGAVSFAERYSNTTHEVATEGRRGALMISMSVKHPDIELFIDSKLDKNKINYANISVKVDDKFMEAVKVDGDYIQTFPIDLDINNHTGFCESLFNNEIKYDKLYDLQYKGDNNYKGCYAKKIKAKKLWDKLIHNAKKSAEPGILFWDNFKRESPSEGYKGFELQGVNPCQPLWAKVLTKNGIRNIGEINIGDEIWSKEGWTKVINIYSNGIKKVFKYSTTFNTFYGTENHKILSNNKKIEIKDSKYIDLLKGFNKKSIINFKIVMDGIVLGDGSVHKASDNLVYLCIGKDDYDYFNSEISKFIVDKRDGLKKDIAYTVVTSITDDELPLTYLRNIPDRYLYGDYNTVCSFLRGLYTANGSVTGKRVTLKSSSKKLIEQVRLMLSSIGISSYYTTNKKKKVKFNNGTYECKESYDLNITRDKQLFYDNIGFIQKYKMDKLKSILVNKSNSSEIIYKKIRNVEFISEEEVIDITVNNNSHTYWTEGCNVSNCSELSLSDLESCRLLSINLYSYVKNSFTKNAEFDFNLFKKHSIIAQRIMDDIVDLEIEKVNSIIKKVESDPEDLYIKNKELLLWKEINRKGIEGRRTGCGITGEGDMLAALGIKYGTDRGNDFCEEVHKTMAIEVYKSSIILAKERGVFPIWDWEKEKDNPFIKRIINEDVSIGYNLEKYGRRNIACLTIAPTGTTSLMTQTTSGIEPCFLPVYKRRRKIEDGSIVDELGDHWEEYNVFHHKFVEWYDINWYKTDVKLFDLDFHKNIEDFNDKEIEKLIQKSPYYKATANEIDYLKKVEMQGRIQKWVDHSISVTHNLPKGIKEEEVSKIYMKAYEVGCKGMTVYVDGSRSGVLIGKEKKEQRPDELLCDIYVVKVKGNDWIVLVGLKDNRPYEIFAFKQGNLQITHDLPNAKLIKRKLKGGNKYDLIANSHFKLNDISSFFKLGEEQSLTRQISLNLRYGVVPIEEIIDQLDKAVGSVVELSKAVSRVLKKYIKDNKVSDQCPECGSTDLVREAGCVRCNNCGYSKC